MKQYLMLYSGILFMLIFHNAEAQIDTLITREQMHQDFLQLIEIIQDINPQLAVRKEMTGVDNIELIKKMEMEIDTISDYYRFINLLNNALNHLYDIHAVRTSYFSSAFDNLSNIDTIAIKQLADTYSKWREKHTYRLKWFPCNPTYINGEYYLHGKYFFMSKSSPFDTIILTNPMIVSYNGNSYFDYIKENISRFQSGSVRWDYKSKKYYCVRSAFEKTGSITLKEKNRAPISINLTNYNIGVSGISNPQIRKEFISQKQTFNGKRGKRVIYLTNEKVLYIYINNMRDNNDSILTKILIAAKGKTIRKVIIDVRGNTGGSDIYWQRILSVLIPDSIPYESHLAFCNSSRLVNYFDNKKKFLNDVDTVSFNWLHEGNPYLVTKNRDFWIVPDSNSIGFKGKIYVIQDENVFSSGHSISSYCSQVEQLISVGVPTGLLAGFGINPFLFQLHNSKFTFRLEPAIDISNVSSVVDVYHDIPEIQLEIPFEEIVKDLDYKWIDKRSVEYLTKKDYIVMKILEME